jgi:hypothetical protein
MRLFSFVTFVSFGRIQITNLENWFSCLTLRVFWSIINVNIIFLMLLFSGWFCGLIFLFIVNSFSAYVYLMATLYTFSLVCVRTKIILRDLILDEINQKTSYLSNGVATASSEASMLLLDNLYILGMLLPVLMALRSLCKFTIRREGNLIPISKCEIAKRNMERNEWDTSPKIMDVKIEGRLNNMTSDQVEEKLMRHLYTMKFRKTKDPNVMGVVNVLRVRANWLLIPKHAYDEVDFTKTCKFICDVETTGRNKIGYLQTDSMHDLHNDYVAVLATGIDTNGDIRHLFLGEKPVLGQKCQAKILIKRDGLIYPAIDVLAQSSNAGHGLISRLNSFIGPMSGSTQLGDCGSPWVRVGNPRGPIGLHIGSKPHAKMGLCCFISKKQLDFMDGLIRPEGKETEEKSFVFNPPPLENIPTRLYDQEYFDTFDVHEKAAVRELGLDPLRGEPAIGIHGSMTCVSATTKSEIIRTDLSPHLVEAGIPCLYGRPPIHTFLNHEHVLRQAAYPMKAINPAAMKFAQADYVATLLEKIKMIDYRYRPLSQYETIHGRKEQNLKSMNMRTSSGIGLSGPKYNHFDSEETPEGLIYTPKGYISHALAEQDDKLRRGERCCPIAKTAIKDEPTLLTKTKARLFYIFPLTAVMLGRRYLGPIVSLLAAMPLDSEAWFGVKTTTEEWGQCHRYLDKFKNGKRMNGDYKGYDLRTSAQTIMDVGSVFLVLAEEMGYTRPELLAIQAYFADLANPIYAFAGTLISFMGLMPSGNPATVAINSVGNSLMHRAFYYEQYLIEYGTTPPVGSFRHYVSMGFVGDDSIGGMSDRIPWFNMTNYQKYMREYGMEYTDANKSAILDEFVAAKDASLCKRLFVEQPDGMVDAPIAIDSIWKSLHMLHKAQEEESLIVAMNCDQALRELARHPRTTFEECRNIIIKAADKAGISLFITHKDRSFDEWRADIRAVYNGIKEEQDDYLDEADRFILAT